MKFRTLLVNGLIVAATLFLIGCTDFNTETASAFGNQGWFDTTYTFDKAIINTFDGTIYVDVDKWNEYEGSDAIQILAEDGTTYYTLLNNVILIAD